MGELEGALLAIAAVLIALVVVISIVRKAVTRGEAEAAATAQAPRQPAEPLRARRSDRTQASVRRRRAAAAAAAQREQQSESEAEEEEEQAGRQGGRAVQHREPEAAGRPARRKDAYEERRAARDRQREEEDAAADAESARLQAKEAARQDAEAAQWMGMISTEAGGSGEAESDQDCQGLLESFVQYVQQRKTVELEELAAEFAMRVQDVIDRVKALEEMGRLTGVMDDRGKYIYISMEEMTAVAHYIRKKGRVAISELAAQSSTFISLEVQDVATAEKQVADLEAGLFGADS